MYYYSDLYSNFTIANFDSQQDYENCGSTFKFGSALIRLVSAGMYETTPDILMLS